MNVAALLQAAQQLGAAQEQPEAAEAPWLDELRQMRANVTTLSQQLEALAQAMQLMVRQVGMALTQASRPPPTTVQAPPPRRHDVQRLPLLDPEHVRLVDDDEPPAGT